MSSLADALASLESANASIAQIAGSYPREFPNARTSRPIDLTSELTRVSLEQHTLRERLRSETNDDDHTRCASRRARNFFVAPGGVLVNAVLVPEPPCVIPKPKPKSPQKTTHPQNGFVNVGATYHSAEACAVRWLRERVVPLLPKQHDAQKVFGVTTLTLETFPLDEDDEKVARGLLLKKCLDRGFSDEETSQDASSSSSVGGFFVTDASGFRVLRVLLEVRETPSSCGARADRQYGGGETQSRFGNEQWTFSRLNRAARLPGPCVVLMLGLNGEAACLRDQTLAGMGNGVDNGVSNGEQLETHTNNLYKAWCVPKGNALALRDKLKNVVYVTNGDSSCKWRFFKVEDGNGKVECKQCAASGIADVLAAHINASLASRGQSVDLHRAVASSGPRMETSTVNTTGPVMLPKPRRRAALLDALGLWTHDSEASVPTKQPPGSAAPAMAPAQDGLPRPDFSIATLRLDYDMCSTFRVLHVTARVVSTPSWDIGEVCLRKPGRPVFPMKEKFGVHFDESSGGFGAPYSKKEFDLLFVHVGETSSVPGVFVIPMNDLVSRLAVLGEFTRRGQTLTCDADSISPDLRMMIPTSASRWRGVAPATARGGDAGVVQGQFVDTKGAWALDYFVPYPSSIDDVTGAVDEVKRLLLGEKQNSWDGKWTHPAFRI